MAEALAVVGIVSSIIQVVEFSAKVAERLNDFASSVGEVPRAFRHIQTELPLIIDSLRRIQKQSESGSVETSTVNAVWPVLKDCQREITRLQHILDKTVPSVGDSSWDRRKKAFQSLGKDKEVEEIANSLSRYVRVLTLHQALEVSKPESEPPPKYQPAKPQYFTLIPFDRNPHFVDREDIFKQIDESFNVKKGSQPKAALFGLGGIGHVIPSVRLKYDECLLLSRKSQIALEYCFRRKERNPECSVFWVHAATLARFEETYKRIATECGIISQEEEAQVDATMLVQNWLENRHEGSWLMVVDNIDDAEVFFKEPMTNKKTLSQCIPRTGKGSLLFTTRSRDIAVDLILPAKPIPVPMLTKSEGAELLRSRLPGDHSDEHIFELLEELEYIPLAITQAAAFMSKRRRTIPQYLDLYRKSDSARVRMLSYEFSDHGRQYNSMESVAKTWTISFESIRKGNPRSADLLSLMCYFDRHAIPAALLTGEDEDELDFEDAVAVLRAFSLIESDEAGASFDMHNIVQLATKLWLIDEKRGEEDKWALEALKSLARNFPAPLHHTTPKYWQLCRNFLPHAQLILTHPFRVQQDHVELARATLLFSISRYLHWRGQVMEAKAKNEESLKIREKVLGEKHPDTLRSMGQLAWMYPWISMEQEGVDLGERCLKLRREVLGENDPETIDCLSDLAMAYQMMDRLQISEEMQRKAYEASKRVLGPEHLDTLNCLSHWASVLDDMGRYQEAEAALRKVIRIKTRILGEDNSSLFSEMHNLAFNLEHQSKYTESEEVYRQALALKTKLYGKTHVETLLTLANLVLLLQDQTKYSDIVELSGWFLGEEELLQEKEKENPRLKSAMQTLRRFSFRIPGYISSESSDSGYSDEESEEELGPIPEEKEDKSSEAIHNKLMEVA
jgi:tetratricopeptide (TPR) repeat protein